MNAGPATTSPGSTSSVERLGMGQASMAATPMGLVDIALLGILLVGVASATTWAVVSGLSGADSNGPGSAFVAGSALLASILTLVAALRRWRHGVAVAPWLGLTIACHVWLIGAVIAIVIQFYLGHDLTVPAVVDVPLLAFAPIVVWSFLPMFQRQRDRLGQAALLLDGAIIGLLAVVAVVTPILGDRAAGSALSPSDRAVVMLWLLSAVLVVLPAFPIALTSPRYDRFWVWPMVTGVGFLGVGQALHASGLRQDMASISHPVALCWSVGFLLVAVAAVFGGWQSRAVAERQSTGGALTQGLMGFGALPVLRTGPTFAAAGVIGLTLLLVAIREDLGLLATAVCVVAVIAITARIVLAATQTERLLRSAATLEIERRLESERGRHARTGIDPVAALEQAVAGALAFRRVRLLRHDGDAPAGAAAEIDPDATDERALEGLTVPLTVDGTPIGTGRFATEGRRPPSRTQLDGLLAVGPWIGPALLRAQREAATLRRWEMVAELSAWLRSDAGEAFAVSLEGRLERLRATVGAAGSRLDRWDPVAGTNRVVAVAGVWEGVTLTGAIEDLRSRSSGPAARFLGVGSTLGSAVVLLGLLSPAGSAPVTLAISWESGAGPVTADASDDAVAVALFNLIAAAFGATTRAGQSPARREAVRQRASRVLSESQDRQATLDGLTEVALTLDSVSHAAVLLWAPINDEYEVAATHARPGARSLFIAGERSSLAMLPSVRRVLETRQPVAGFANETSMTQAETSLFEESGAAVLAIVPILRGERCFGALVLGSGEIEPFPGDGLSLFTELASSAALAIERDRPSIPRLSSIGIERFAAAEPWEPTDRIADSPATPR